MSKPYVYKRPTGKHYRVSIKNWNKYYGRRGKYPYVESNIYVDGDTAIAQHSISIIGKILLILFSPLIYTVNTLAGGIGETHSSFTDAIFDISRGKFSSDPIYKYTTSNNMVVISSEWLKLRALVGDYTI